MTENGAGCVDGNGKGERHVNDYDDDDDGVDAFDRTERVCGRGGNGLVAESAGMLLFCASFFVAVAAFVFSAWSALHMMAAAKMNVICMRIFAFHETESNDNEYVREHVDLSCGNNLCVAGLVWVVPLRFVVVVAVVVGFRLHLSSISGYCYGRHRRQGVFSSAPSHPLLLSSQQLQHLIIATNETRKAKNYYYYYNLQCAPIDSNTPCEKGFEISLFALVCMHVLVRCESFIEADGIQSVVSESAS